MNLSWRVFDTRTRILYDNFSNVSCIYRFTECTKYLTFVRVSCPALTMVMFWVNPSGNIAVRGGFKRGGDLSSEREFRKPPRGALRCQFNPRTVHGHATRIRLKRSRCTAENRTRFRCRSGSRLGPRHSYIH